MTTVLQKIPFLVWASLWACRADPASPDSQPTEDDGDEDDVPQDTVTTPPWDSAPYDPIWDELSQRIEAELAERDVPGIQVAVVIDGQLRYAGGFGVRGYGTELAVTDQTAFRWASVAKMHTATAALQLVEDGLVDLDAPITDTVPYFGLNGGFDASSITLRHLLTHTSGLPDALVWDCDTRDRALADAVADWDLPLHAPAGSFYNYSNTGFNLAGAMIEEVTGGSFLEVIEERVLTPSGMTRGTYDADEAIEKGHADGTGIWNGEPFVYALEDWDCAVSRPAAWLHGTASDLAQTAVWQLSDDGGGLLSTDLIAQMHDQRDTGFWSDQRYRVGMGQFTEQDRNGERLVMHDGWVTGFSSMWIVAPDRDFGVAVVANADWADTWGLAVDAVDLFLDLPSIPPPDDRTDPATWTRFEGRYFDPYEYGTIDVSLRGNRLWADLPDLGIEAELFQSGASYFWIDLWDRWVDVRFVEDDTGGVRWFVTRHGVGTRTTGPVARRPRTWERPPVHPVWPEGVPRPWTVDPVGPGR